MYTARIVAAVACVLVAVALHHARSPLPPPPPLPRPVPTLDWSVVQDGAALRGELPPTPVLLRGSPMQAWHTAHRDAWAVSTVAALAAETDAGDYNVTWLSQRHTRDFINHNRERYDQYDFVDGSEGSAPRHQRRVATLRSALRELWRDSSSSDDSSSHYVTAFIDDLPRQPFQTLTEWLPAGCLRDDRFEAASEWDESVADHSTLADCRNLNSVVWFGAANVRVSTHYDISHNLFFQLSGSKRFDLLPPSAHSALRLYPFWHGSNRQAQASLPLADSDQPMWRAELEPGDVLLLPSRWFHRVESLSASIGINWWTGGLDRDVWLYVLGANRDEEAWDGGTRWSRLACARQLNGISSSSSSSAAAAGAASSMRLDVLDCARDGFAALLACLEHGTPEHPRMGRQQLSRRAKALLQARYEPIRQALPSGVAAAAVTEHCQKHQRRGVMTAGKDAHSLASDGEWIAAVQNAAMALRLLSATNLDLALDDLLDHTAAWAVGQAVPGGADGAAVWAFLTDCT